MTRLRVYGGRRMGSRICLAFFIVFTSAACSTPGQSAPQQPSAATQQPAAATQQPSAEAPTKLTFGTNSELAFSVTPMLAAFDALKEDGTGIEVEVLALEDTQVALQAMIAQEVDFAILDAETVPVANTRGADLRLFFVGQNNEWLLVSRSDISTPQELDGVRLGHHGTGSSNWVMVQDTVQKYNVNPEFLTVPGSENRVLALIADQLDASLLTFADFEALERQRPGDFHILLDYEEEMPGVMTGENVVAPKARLDELAPTFETVTGYMVEYYRKAGQDPGWLAEQALEYFPDGDPDEFLASANALAEADVYKSDGGLSGLTPENMQTFLEAMVLIGTISEEDIQPFDSIVDLRFLRAANE
jgi:ABC-type nitrate/sulfonate/bicarbonate transport system substrate-binding protein